LQPSGIDVLVVGAGIGGLSAAIELWRKGHDVRVIEAKDGIADLGLLLKYLMQPELITLFRRLCRHWGKCNTPIRKVAGNVRTL
jgi:2-polyprenyl-6-methoxyphenol hydroxylase-like FAD-dependent oxidoreductase